MSLYARSKFGYLQQAEAFFLSHSQIGLMLGSKDTEMLRQWRNMGVPIEVICAGIKRAFEQFQEPPRRVSNCRKMIEKELHDWRVRQAGGHDSDEDDAQDWRTLPGKELPDPTDPRRRKHRESLRQKKPSSHKENTAARDAKRIPEDERYLELWYRCMWRLTEQGQRATTAVGRDAYRWAYKQMQQLRLEALDLRDDPEALSRLGLVIGEIEASMYERFYSALSSAEQGRLDSSLPMGVENMLQNMSPAARERQRRVWRRRLIEEKLLFKPFFVP